MPLRRLSRQEYDNTVRDLLGDTSGPARGLAGDVREGHGFLTGAGVDTVDATRLMDAAEGVGARAVERLPELTSCATAAAGESGCDRDVITTFGRRAYRRPLTETEVTALQAFYEKARKELGHDHEGAVRLVVTVMLQSPNFLYRWELGGEGAREGDQVRLGPHAVASRLSYYLWSSMPDDTLFAAADADQLRTPAQIEAQARRMLKDPKAAQTVSSFYLQWLEMTGAAEVTKNAPEFTADTAQAAAEEVRLLLQDLFLGKGDGRLRTLLTGRGTFVNGALAKLYGIAGVNGSDFVPRSLDMAQRAGILTTPAFLATHANGADSHPVKRGVVVLERLLCEHPPAPPQNVPEPKAPAPDLPTRERFAAHATNAGCAACHKLFDPLGFAFEHYDGLGRYRTRDGGKTVDASGTVTTAGGEALRFGNAIELAETLAASPQVRACMARQWLRFALGRAEVAADQATLETATAAFAQKDHDLRELMVALVTGRSFLYRTPAEGEAP